MADKFKYRMGKILSLRERKEDKLKRDKAAAERERDRERDALDELITRLGAAKRSIGSSLAAGQTANVQMGNDYASSLEKKIEEQEKKLKAAQAKVDEFERLLALATRDVRILEKHRAISRERWKSEEDRKEAIVLNEMATQGYLKRRNLQTEEDAEEEARQAALASAEEALTQSAWISGLVQSAAEEARRRKAQQKKV